MTGCVHTCSLAWFFFVRTKKKLIHLGLLSIHSLIFNTELQAYTVFCNGSHKKSQTILFWAICTCCMFIHMIIFLTPSDLKCFKFLKNIKVHFPSSWGFYKLKQMKIYIYIIALIVIFFFVHSNGHQVKTGVLPKNVPTW